MWELRLVPHEVSLGFWGRVWGGGCQFWTVVAAVLRGTDDFQALAFGLFSGKIPGVHSGSVLVGFREHFRRFMRAFGGGFGHFRRLMRAFGRVLSSLSADEPVSHGLSIVELSSQPVALKSRDATVHTAGKNCQRHEIPWLISLHFAWPLRL